MHNVLSTKVADEHIVREDIDRELENESSDRDGSGSSLRQNALKVLKDYQSKKKETDTWTVTEDSVRVRTTKYSGMTLTIACAIIGGGLTVPFLVKEGIPGVDPFQFVTFGWLLAGAFLVVAKSRYTENWPWHDFLRGHIVCRSVSELAVASRVSKQAVLLYLLHHEYKNPLVFRGPYHGAFRRQASTGAKGFDIDVPTGHATVLAAGFIVLQIFDKGEKERRVHTMLQDTRKDVPGSSRQLVFDPDEALDDEDEPQRLGYQKPTRLKLVDESSSIISQCEILGVPTTDYDFI